MIQGAQPLSAQRHASPPAISLKNQLWHCQQIDTDALMVEIRIWPLETGKQEVSVSPD